MNRITISVALFAAASLAFKPVAADAGSSKPTIVLVHGAMADASSWSGVVPLLVKDGYKVVAVADPLRNVTGDADYVASILKTLEGPVVLVGHSYGGTVITNAAEGDMAIKALVYVAAFAPDKGESAFDLIGRFPGSELGAALSPPIALRDGSHDLVVDPEKFVDPFAADLPASQAELMAAKQRPVNEKALKEASRSAAWKSLPSFFVYGSADKSIPPALQAFMAKRAKSRDTVVVQGASHLVMLSHPDKVVALIEEASEAN